MQYIDLSLSDWFSQFCNCLTNFSSKHLNLSAKSSIFDCTARSGFSGTHSSPFGSFAFPFNFTPFPFFFLYPTHCLKIQTPLLLMNSPNLSQCPHLTHLLTQLVVSFSHMSLLAYLFV